MSATNVTDNTNQQIFNFVQRPANRRLMPGTGGYSTPFRGSLFGLSESVAVAQQLKTRRIDALWLGSNPCMPRSLTNILSTRRTDGDFPDFQRQMESGLFSSRRWDAQGRPSPDWNPIQEPRGNWRVYADVLADTFGSLDAVTMANCLPWGSKTTRDFVATLDERDPALLKRALRFADDLNAEIVAVLNPKLILVPFSFGRNSQIDRVHRLGVAMSQATNRCDHQVEAEHGPAFRFTVGICRRGPMAVESVQRSFAKSW